MTTGGIVNIPMDVYGYATPAPLPAPTVEPPSPLAIVRQRVQAGECAMCASVLRDRRWRLCRVCVETHKYCPACEAVKLRSAFTLNRRPHTKEDRDSNCHECRSGDDPRCRSVTELDRSGAYINRLRACGYLWKEIAIATGLTKTTAECRWYRWCKRCGDTH